MRLYNFVSLFCCFGVCCTKLLLLETKGANNDNKGGKKPEERVDQGIKKIERGISNADELVYSIDRGVQNTVNR